MNLNKVHLIGNLTRDPEVRTTPAGQTVTAIDIATNRTWNNAQTGQKETQVEYHHIVCWGKLGEVVGQYLIKGQSAYVEGRLQTRSWQDQKSGDKRYRTEIVAENVQFGAKPVGAAYGPTNNTRPTTNTTNNQPLDVGSGGSEVAQAEDLPIIQEDEPEIEVKDIPF